MGTEEQVGIDEAKEVLARLVRGLSHEKEARSREEERSKGKPQNYKINILSMGDVGLEIAKILATTTNPTLNDHISEINLCHRILTQVRGGGKIDVYDFEQNKDFVIVDKTRTQAQLIRTIGLEKGEKIRENPYQRLTDLEGLLTQYPDSNPLGSITIVCPRYNFSFEGDISKRALDGKRKEYARSSDSRLEAEINAILRQRRGIISSFYKSPRSDEELLARQEEAVRINRELERISRIAKKEHGIAENRIYNLKENFIGIKELGKFFRAIDYQGVVMMVTNPLDLMTNIFCREYGLNNHRRVIGAADNDRLRAILTTMEALKSKFPKYMLSSASIPVIGTHDEFQVWAARNSKLYGSNTETGEKVDGKNFFELGGTEAMLEYAHEIAAKRFPHEEFALLGTTAHDTAPGIINIIESIIEDKNGKEVRVSSYEPFNSSAVWIGGPTRFMLSKEYRARDFSEYDLTSNDKRTFANGIRIQAATIDMLVEAELIPKIEYPVEDRKIIVPIQEHSVREKVVVVEKPIQVEPSITPKPLETRLYVASGKEVIELDGNLVKKQSYDFPHDIRCVRVIDNRIYAGYINGVMVSWPFINKVPSDMFEIPELKGRKEGHAVNSVAVWNSKLYLTHSDIGLGCFDLNTKKFRKIFGNTGDGVTRGLTEKDTKLYFSSGIHVYSLEKDIVVNPLFHGDDEILALAVGNSVYASDESGNLMKYNADKLDKRKGNKILSLDAAIINGEEFIFTVDWFGNVERLDSKLVNSVRYQGIPQTIADYASVNYANGLVFASSVKEGSKNYRLYAWDFNQPQKPLADISLAHTIRDAFVRSL